MTRQNAKVPVYDAQHIEPKPKPRYVDVRPFSALVLVGIAALYVAVLIVAGRVW